MSQSKRSAWLARKIRKRRRHRSRSVVLTVVASLTLMVIPLFLRLPVKMEDMAVVSNKDIYRKDNNCQPTPTGELAIRKGSGTYNLDKPQNQTNTDYDATRKSWSQYGQDIWVDTYFGQKRGGIFVEVGGYDGETHSNTLLLEKERGWQGILIEANPYSFKLMKGKDRSCWMAHACIQSRNHSTLTFQLAGGITSAMEVASPQHKQRIQTDLPNYRHQANWKGAGDTFCMSCNPFRTILEHTSLPLFDSTSPGVIDYFSMDVEGAELELLQTLLDEKKKLPEIRVFTIEMQENAHEIRQWLTAKNYQEIAVVGIDSVFVHKT
eukprot:scaffold5978_cov157-Amphora_coffeaeformis.AAC.1